VRSDRVVRTRESVRSRSVSQLPFTSTFSFSCLCSHSRLHLRLHLRLRTCSPSFYKRLEGGRGPGRLGIGRNFAWKKFRSHSLPSPLDCLSKNHLAISKARSVRYQRLSQTKIYLSPPPQLSNAPEQSQTHIPSAPVQISPLRNL
jgi:hypothetical protein